VVKKNLQMFSTVLGFIYRQGAEAPRKKEKMKTVKILEASTNNIHEISGNEVAVYATSNLRSQHPMAMTIAYEEADCSPLRSFAVGDLVYVRDPESRGQDPESPTAFVWWLSEIIEVNE